MAQTWVVALVAIAIVHLVATVALYYLLGVRPADNDTTSAVATNADSTDNEVICPNCGTPNRADYRYCRQCVSPLSAGPKRSGGDNSDSLWIR